MGLLSLLPAYAQTNLAAGATTAAETAESLDKAWQEASSKYDSERAALLKNVDRVSGAGPFLPEWESLRGYTVPDWYQDAKFGIFIHWGVYSVPAFGNEWYPRNMYKAGTEENRNQVALHGPLTDFGYKDFIPMFKAEHFDPQSWARLFKQAGAQYVIPVAEHHDGFAMYDSALSDWTAARMGPKRDTTGELARAVRAEGMHFGLSSHRVEHDFFLGEGREQPSDVNDPRYAQYYGPAHRWMESKTTLLDDFTYLSAAYADDWLARSAELVEKYHPEVVYFDWWIGKPELRARLARFTAFYYNDSLKRGGPVGVVDYKKSAMAPGSGVLDIERGQLTAIQPMHWQTDTSVSNTSWGYIENDTFKTPEFIVHQLVDVVSKNGNLLLNVGPRADGTIPDEVQQILRSVGGWLKLNGEAIYGTRPWRSFGEGPTRVTEGAFHDTDTKPYTPQDFRFTTKGDTLYAIELGWPGDGEAVVRSLGTGPEGSERRVASVELLGSPELLGSSAAIPFEQRRDGLHLKVPRAAPGVFAYAYRVRFVAAGAGAR